MFCSDNKDDNNMWNFIGIVVGAIFGVWMGREMYDDLEASDKEDASETWYIVLGGLIGLFLGWVAGWLLGSLFGSPSSTVEYPVSTGGYPGSRSVTSSNYEYAGLDVPTSSVNNASALRRASYSDALRRQGYKM